MWLATDCPRCLTFEPQPTFIRRQQKREQCQPMGISQTKLAYNKCRDLWHGASCLERFPCGHNGAFLLTFKLHHTIFPCLKAWRVPQKYVKGASYRSGRRKMTPCLFIVYICSFLFMVRVAEQHVRGRKQENRAHRLTLTKYVNMGALWRPVG